MIIRIIPLVIITLLLSACAENNTKSEVNTGSEKAIVKEPQKEQSQIVVKQKPTPEEKFKKKYHTFDLNKDGKVTRDEFVKRSHAEFKEKDKNHDNMVDKNECPGFAMLNPEGNPVDENQYVKLRGERFDDMNTDKNDILTENEFVSYKLAFAKKMKAKKAAATAK